MKHIWVAVFLLTFLAACKAPAARETPGADEAVRASSVAETPAPEALATERFRVGEYNPEVTVAVYWDAQSGGYTVTVEQDGAVCQTIAATGEFENLTPVLTVEDINFDGYLDFRFRYGVTVYHGLEHCYVWNQSENKFEPVPELDKLTDLSFDAETQTVCSYERSTAYHQYDILRWTKSGLAYLRRALFGREVWPEGKTWAYAYRVWDHDPAAPPMERDGGWNEIAYWNPGEVEADPNGVQEEFDKWMDPAYYGENVAVPSYIPTDLLDYLTDLLEQGKGYEPFDNCNAFLDRYGVDYRPGEAFSIFTDKVWSENWDGGMLAGVYGYMADVDNDGVGDAVLLSDQGSGHFTTLYFIRGLANGDYEYVFDVPFNRCNRNWCISWKGTNYLVSMAENQWVRHFTGYNLYLLNDGAVQDRVFLSAVQTDWGVSAKSAEPGYEAAADHMEAVGADIWTEYNKTGKQHIGSAERRAAAADIGDISGANAEDLYMCDWNGDGTEERYSKMGGGCNASGRALATSLNIGQETDGEVGLAQMVWFDKVGEETLLIRVSNWGDDPVTFEAFCANTADGWDKVASVTLESAHRAVTRYRRTRGENVDFRTADWNWAWSGNIE